MNVKPTKCKNYDWIWLCWCDFMAWNIKIQSRMKREKKNAKKTAKTNTQNAYFLCCRKMKMAFDSFYRVKLGEKKEKIVVFCRWRVYLDFSIVCELSIPFRFVLFVRCFVFCACGSVYVACKAKCWLFFVEFIVHLKQVKPFICMNIWLNKFELRSSLSFESIFCCSSTSSYIFICIKLCIIVYIMNHYYFSCEHFKSIFYF